MANTVAVKLIIFPLALAFPWLLGLRRKRCCLSSYSRPLFHLLRVFFAKTIHCGIAAAPSKAHDGQITARAILAPHSRGGCLVTKLLHRPGASLPPRPRCTINKWQHDARSPARRRDAGSEHFNIATRVSRSKNTDPRTRELTSRAVCETTPGFTTRPIRNAGRTPRRHSASRIEAACTIWEIPRRPSPPAV